MLERVKLRLGITDAEKDSIISELITTVKSRIALRVGLKDFPTQLDSIAVDIVVTYFNRIGAEGSETEKLDVISTTYIKSIMSEYNEEFQAYKNGLADDIENINARRSNKARLI